MLLIWLQLYKLVAQLGTDYTMMINMKKINHNCGQNLSFDLTILDF